MIYVDADACPVKDEVLRVAARYKTKVFIVSNGGLRPSRDPMVENVTVAAGPDVADAWIADRAADGDVVITADIPLAALCLEAGAAVIGPTGRAFDANTIGAALAMRQLKQDLREANQSQTYNRSFTKQDRSNFLQALDLALVRAQKTPR